ncbi:MAG: serine/threonine-protein kinase [Thermoflexales bacterium]
MLSLRAADRMVNLMLTPGTVLRERYRITSPIGQGGMGSVFLAEDLRLEGRRCAVKVMRVDSSMGAAWIAEVQRQFAREASVLARLDHVNLPKVSDYFIEGDMHCLVMDYVAGKNLKEIVDEVRRQGRFLPEAEVLSWAQQLCDALEYMHSQTPPVVHRDIKPSNIRFTPSGIIKLVDFGLVKLMHQDDMQTITVLRGHGTIAYTPLEQYGEDNLHTDVRADIYALGATLYHLLTNTPPADARRRFLEPDALVPIRALNPAVSPHVESAVSSAMALHPSDRPASIAEFRHMLFALPSDTTRTHWLRLQQRANPVRDNWPWLLLAGAATGAALILSL